tara:strand:+ start:231 stop:530 length:300 start_codon:yes stop_codon:yes gene_type:complete
MNTICFDKYREHPYDATMGSNLKEIWQQKCGKWVASYVIEIGNGIFKKERCRSIKDDGQFSSKKKALERWREHRNYKILKINTEEDDTKTININININA